PRCGRTSRSVESDESFAVPENREQIRADAVAARLDERQRDRGRERGIDRAAAAQEHRDARLRGERLRRRDGRLRKDRLASRWIGKRPVEGTRGVRGRSLVVHRRDYAAAVTPPLPQTLPRASCECWATRSATRAAPPQSTIRPKSVDAQKRADPHVRAAMHAVSSLPSWVRARSRAAAGPARTRAS